jgi:hypothetical protein
MSAEREYWINRLAELRREGEGLGVNVDDLTAMFEQVNSMAPEVAAALTALGNPTLAGRYSAALTALLSAVNGLHHINDAGVIDERQRESMMDALEDFERVEAETRAWLDRPGA